VKGLDMKRFAAAILVGGFCACAWAQQKPAPAAPEKPEAKAEAAKPQAQKVSGDRKSRRWHEDARQCLGKSSNTEIIKCAEAYL
jgi:hypothetical protein